MDRPSALSLFAGLGGFDVAARIAGLEVALATDIDDEALQLLVQAYQTPTICSDIDDLLRQPLPSAWRPPASLRYVIGGPPCTAFSHAGFWIEEKRSGRDPAARLLTSYVETLEQVRPNAFILENVPGLAFRTHRAFLEDLLRRAREQGYTTTLRILDAADFGVAQTRRRLFVVGVQSGRPVDLERWPYWPRRSAHWAIGEFEDSSNAEPDEVPRGAYTELLKNVPPGRNYLVFTDRFGYDPPLFRNRGRYWSFLLKASSSEPVPTLPAQRVTFNGPFHWSSRHFRVPELRRLQSFPDWYPVSSCLNTARRHIGNAVPPLLAAAVLWRVRQTLGEVPSDAWPPALTVAMDASATARDVSRAYPVKSG